MEPARAAGRAGCARQKGSAVIRYSQWLVRVDDLRVYSRAITPAEVSTIYNGGNGIDY